MIGNVPDGWQEKNLGELVSLVIGKTPSRNIPEYFQGNNLWTSIRDMNNYIITTTKEKITDEAITDSKIKKVKKGTLLLSYKLSIGKLSFAGEDLYTNEAIAGLQILDSSISNKFLYYVLKATDLERTIDRAVMGKTLNKAKLQVIPIAYPPLPQQEKIVKVLDISSGLIEKQKELIENYDLFLKSKFIEMFGDPIQNPMGWEVEKLGNFILDVKNGLTRRGKTNSGDIVLKLKDIRENYIRFENLNRINLDKKEKEKFIAEKNDLLFIRVNGNPEYVGRCAVYNGYTEAVYFNDHIMRIKIDTKKYNAVFLGFIVNSPYGKKQILKYRKTSAGQHTISQDGLERLSFYLPPIDLQNKFASIVEKTETIKTKETQKLEHLKTLHSILMDKAFKGEIF